LSRGEHAPATTLTLLTRPECGLCEQMLQELSLLAREHPLPRVQLLDVDSDPLLQRRYGLKIPVLLLHEVPICCERWRGPAVRADHSLRRLRL